MNKMVGSPPPSRSSGAGAPAQMLNNIRVQLTQPSPLFSGIIGSGSISARQWISSLEANFANNGITDDVEKINKAKSGVDYEKGDARDVITSTNFNTFAELKRTILLFFDKSVDTPTLDFDAIREITWTSGQSFPNFMNKLMLACDNLERTLKFTSGTAFELGKGMILSIIKRQFAPHVHQKVEDKALLSLCGSRTLLQTFLLDVYQIIGKHQRTDKVFNLEAGMDELSTMYMDSSKKVTWDSTRNRDNYNKRRDSNSQNRYRSTYREPPKDFNRSRYSSTPPKYSTQRSPSPYRSDFEKDRRDNNQNQKMRGQDQAYFRDRARSRSYSPRRVDDMDLMCYNCGNQHVGGAKNCKECLVCGRSNHPTRECKLRKKIKAKERVQYLEEERDTEEGSDDEGTGDFFG